jgi:hypothetical protein
MTDPGRYHHLPYFTVSDYKNKNNLILNEYLFHMLEREIITFKLVKQPNRKAHLLAKTLEKEKGEKPYSEYFNEQVSKFESPQEFLKTKGRYL